MAKIRRKRRFDSMSRYEGDLYEGVEKIILVAVILIVIALGGIGTCVGKHIYRAGQQSVIEQQNEVSE